LPSFRVSRLRQVLSSSAQAVSTPGK
jgi:hypothetical protein